MHSSIVNRQFESVIKTLREGDTVDVKKINSMGYTLLDLAVAEGAPCELILWLIYRGASLKTSKNPLALAYENGNLLVVQLLSIFTKEESHVSRAVKDAILFWLVKNASDNRNDLIKLAAEYSAAVVENKYEMKDVKDSKNINETNAWLQDDDSSFLDGLENWAIKMNKRKFAQTLHPYLQKTVEKKQKNKVIDIAQFQATIAYAFKQKNTANLNFLLMECKSYDILFKLTLQNHQYDLAQFLVMNTPIDIFALALAWHSNKALQYALFKISGLNNEAYLKFLIKLGISPYKLPSENIKQAVLDAAKDVKIDAIVTDCLQSRYPRITSGILSNAYRRLGLTSTQEKKKEEKEFLLTYDCLQEVISFLDYEDLGKLFLELGNLSLDQFCDYAVLNDLVLRSKINLSQNLMHLLNYKLKILNEFKQQVEIENDQKGCCERIKNTKYTKSELCQFAFSFFCCGFIPASIGVSLSLVYYKNVDDTRFILAQIVNAYSFAILLSHIIGCKTGLDHDFRHAKFDKYSEKAHHLLNELSHLFDGNMFYTNAFLYELLNNVKEQKEEIESKLVELAIVSEEQQESKPIAQSIQEEVVIDIFDREVKVTEMSIFAPNPDLSASASLLVPIREFKSG